MLRINISNGDDKWMGEFVLLEPLSKHILDGGSVNIKLGGYEEGGTFNECIIEEIKEYE